MHIRRRTLRVRMLAAAEVAVAAFATAPASASVVSHSSPAVVDATAQATLGDELQNANTVQCLDDSAQYGVRGFPSNEASQLNLYQAWNLSRLPLIHRSASRHWIAPRGPVARSWLSARPLPIRT